MVIALTRAHSTCQHHQWDEPLQYLESTESSEFIPFEGRSLQQRYESIRIYADYSNIANISAEAKDYIQKQLMPSTISYFQAALKIVRLTTNLKAETSCYDLNPPESLKKIGVPADLIILVGAEHNGPKGARAISGACGLSLVDSRPSLGVLIFNLDAMSLKTVPEQEEFLTTTIHETTHILGFSRPLYPFYINPETMKKLTNHIRTKTVNGQNITIMDTPPLTAKVRSHFGCDTIEGAYLENEGGSGNQGIHFERRVFQNELMIGSSRPDQVISEIVLALLEGTGWYQPNYSMAEKLTWGKGQGCAFYDGPCVAQGGKSNFKEFCSNLTAQGCSFNNRGKAYCGSQPGNILKSSNLPAAWNYWGNNTITNYLFNDNCPIYSYYTSNSDCENPTSAQAKILTEESFGPTSRCFAGTLTRDTKMPETSGYCFKSACEMLSDKQVVKITVGTRTVICKVPGPVSISGLSGTIQCPNPKEFCATSNPLYCERGCLGRGTCVSGKCQCREGWGGPDCGQRVVKNNCSRCASQVVLKSCYGDVCRRNV